jgi:hypothetical protein
MVAVTLAKEAGRAAIRPGLRDTFGSKSFEDDFQSARASR